MIRNEDICAEVQSGLPLFVGGDLETAPAAEIARHLEQCPVCDEQARAARSARDLLVSALALSERRGPDLWPNVRAVLSEDGLIRGQQASRGLENRDAASAIAPLTASGASIANGNSIGSTSVGSTAKPRTSRRFLSYAAAAAAALIVGLWLGRAAFRAPATGTPDDGSQQQNLVTVPPNEGPAVPIVPVSDTGGLHPLRRGEVPLHMGARSYFDSPGIQAWPNYDPTQATTVEQRVPRWQ